MQKQLLSNIFIKSYSMSNIAMHASIQNNFDLGSQRFLIYEQTWVNQELLCSTPFLSYIHYVWYLQIMILFSMVNI